VAEISLGEIRQSAMALHAAQQPLPGRAAQPPLPLANALGNFIGKKMHRSVAFFRAFLSGYLDYRKFHSERGTGVAALTSWHYA